ncbi:MAG TPA: N-6 DNA methylase, partial [Gallionella sp.]|nr:N-6 DNA methylase [Gallionella sp.]
GYAEAYRDVIHEDAIKIGNSTKAPDYSFRVGGQRKFFLEAKKPSVYVKEAIEPAFQLRRYAWSAKLPLSIVTDFEEFAIYDCRARPDKGDKASKARLFYCTYRDYANKWDEIAAIFSKDSVLKGSFDRYASTSKGKRGTSEVDGAFLEEIEGWRDLLARNIALRNTNLSQRELNFAVQQTIDRIIFLRICEDRGIEPYGKLMALQNGVNVYGRLREMFRDADDRYNSGLFHFKREKGRAEAPDELTLNLEIDDKPLKEIFKNLYYPDCPYEFSVLGADILGQVYEQFLGKVIRLTAGHHAVVEDKPEVKKAGGVFYTPAYIVQYIVAHTVGKLLEGKTPKQVKGISILDPACGSGSFLIGAYQYLLDWYLARYVEEGAEKHSKGKDARLRHSAAGEWRLTTAEKKRILLEHIYGVDIDAQAVEVTKLSLLLKMLEGESDETLNSQMKLFHERVLPDLERNIQCGNSLIGPDFYEGQLGLDDEAARRINVFDWQAAFPQIFKAGGFDAVIGNPPYGATFGTAEAAHFHDNYAVWRGVKDVYALFIETAIKTLNKSGYASFIVPSAWLGGPDYRVLRNFLLNYRIDQIVSLPFDVFADAYVDTAIFVASSSKPRKDHLVNTFSFSKKEKLLGISLTESDYQKIAQQSWIEENNNKFILDFGALALVRSIRSNNTLLFSDVISMKRG